MALVYCFASVILNGLHKTETIRSVRLDGNLKLIKRPPNGDRKRFVIVAPNRRGKKTVSTSFQSNELRTFSKRSAFTCWSKPETETVRHTIASHAIWPSEGGRWSEPDQQTMPKHAKHCTQHRCASMSGAHRRTNTTHTHCRPPHGARPAARSGP